MFDEVHSVLPPLSAADAGTGRFGQRTRIAYDALVETSPKIQKEAEYDGRATCSVY